jgi:ABC-type lipoprotein release transport system permease subunit
VGVLVSSKLLERFLFGVSPFDPIVVALATIAILLLAVIVTLIPAWRTSAVDPMQALRDE